MDWRRQNKNTAPLIGRRTICNQSGTIFCSDGLGNSSSRPLRAYTSALQLWWPQLELLFQERQPIPISIRTHRPQLTSI